MPYKDPEKNREYQRKWVAKRKADWYKDKFCVHCGSVERLELDHIDPKQKISHSIWSWTQEKRDADTAKCQVLCHDCHVKKTKDNVEHPRGSQKPNAKLNEAQVLEIRRRHKAGERQIDLAKQFNVSKYTIYGIVQRRKWKWLTDE